MPPGPVQRSSSRAAYTSASGAWPPTGSRPARESAMYPVRRASAMPASASYSTATGSPGSDCSLSGVTPVRLPAVLVEELLLEEIVHGRIAVVDQIFPALQIRAADEQIGVVRGLDLGVGGEQPRPHVDDLQHEQLVPQRPVVDVVETVEADIRRAGDC